MAGSKLDQLTEMSGLMNHRCAEAARRSVSMRLKEETTTTNNILTRVRPQPIYQPYIQQYVTLPP